MMTRGCWLGRNGWLGFGIRRASGSGAAGSSTEGTSTGGSAGDAGSSGSAETPGSAGSSGSAGSAAGSAGSAGSAGAGGTAGASRQDNRRRATLVPLTLMPSTSALKITRFRDTFTGPIRAI
ncbi:MAG: hypothetical protein U0165_09970 [Polyangiaceae bacterium]